MPADRPKGHHFLPQFLLRGFASRQTGAEYFTNVFRPDRNYEANIRDVAKKRMFHSVEIEKKMATEEDRFAPLVHELRTGGGLDKQEAIRDFVTHLVVRTKNIRDQLTRLGQNSIEALKTTFSDPGNEPQLRLGVQRELDKLIHEAKDPRLTLAITMFGREYIDALLADEMNTINYGDYFIAMLDNMASGLNVETTTRDAHIAVLDKHIVPPKRMEALLSYEWRVEECEDLSLGDVGVIAVSASGDLVSPLNDQVPTVALLVPLSTKRLLIGRSPSVHIPDVNPSEVNTASASLSLEFFIAANITNERTVLQKLIGSGASLYSPADLSKMFRDVL